MGQTVNQLTATKVQKVKTPGMYADGAGLYLQVTGNAAKSWIIRYSLAGRAREMGLGSLRKVSLADARRKAAECHKLLDDHVDPIEHRSQARAAAALACTQSITFKEAATRYMAMRRKGLKNLKHAAQWGTTIATYTEPILGKLLVRDIDVGHGTECWSRSGRLSPRPPAECVAGSKKSLVGPKRTNTGTEKIRPDGGTTSISSCRSFRRCGRSNTIRRFPMPSCRRSWRSCARWKAPQRALSNLQF